MSEQGARNVKLMVFRDEQADQSLLLDDNRCLMRMFDVLRQDSVS